MRRLVRAGNFGEVKEGMMGISVEDYLTYILNHEDEMPENYFEDEQVKSVCNSWMALDSYVVTARSQLDVWENLENVLMIPIARADYFMITFSQTLEVSRPTEAMPAGYRIPNDLGVVINESAKILLESSSLLGLDYKEHRFISSR